MSEPIKKPIRTPESYNPKNPEIANMMDELCSEKIIGTIVIEGVEFQIIEKGRTFYAGVYGIEPDVIEPDMVDADDSNLIFRNDNSVDETVKVIRNCVMPEEYKLYLWIDYEIDERPCAMLFGQETTSREQLPEVHVLEAEPTLLIRAKYTHAAFALAKKLTGKCVHQYQMTEMFGLIKHIFCEGDTAEYEHNGDNGTGNFDAEHFLYHEQYYDGEFMKFADAEKYVTVPVKRRSGYAGSTAPKYSVDKNAIIAEPVAPRTEQEIDAMQEPLKEFKKIKFGGYDWLVLDEQDGKTLLLSEIIIENRRFHHSPVEITWTECELREYLNGEFLNKFSEYEQARIVQAKLPPCVNPWYGTSNGKARMVQIKEKTDDKPLQGTDDHIFILSVEEVVKYFGDSGDLEKRVGLWATSKDLSWRGDGMGQCIYDQYNTARIAKNENGCACGWTTRTPGYQYHYTVPVIHTGLLGPFTGGGVNNPSGIRPAMWIKT